MKVCEEVLGVKWREWVVCEGGEEERGIDVGSKVWAKSDCDACCEIRKGSVVVDGRKGLTLEWLRKRIGNDMPRND